MLRTKEPLYSPDWTSWSSSEERGESFTSSSPILSWVAVTSGCKLLILLKPKPLRGLSQSALITSLTVTLNLGEDSDFVLEPKLPLYVTHQQQVTGLCASAVNLSMEEPTSFLGLVMKILLHERNFLLPNCQVFHDLFLILSIRFEIFQQLISIHYNFLDIYRI